MSERDPLVATIPMRLAGARLDQALAAMFPEYSRSRIQQWIRAGHAIIDGHRRRQRDLVDGGERVEIQVHAEPDPRWQAEPMDLAIVYEDEECLVVEKPAGLVVHPGAGNSSGTLVNALLHHRAELGVVPRAGIIHRLDKDTSGLLLVARSLTAHTRLAALLAERAIRREYQALVLGELPSGGRLDAPVGRHPVRRTRMAVVAGGRAAVSHVRVVERFAGFTRVTVRLETGRTHQIRVHLADAGHPVIGDRTYGGYGKTPAKVAAELGEAVRRFPRQALHACRLSWPGRGDAPVSVTSPLPADMAALLELARREAGR